MQNKSNWLEKDIKCPFYHRSENHKIICEGIITRTKLQTYFENNIDKSNYLKALCCSIRGYHNCPYAKMLEDNYKDEE